MHIDEPYIFFIYILHLFTFMAIKKSTFFLFYASIYS